jgi:hypothetical protein
MARVQHAINHFTVGEVSPRLLARADTEEFRNGCALLENFVVDPHGGVSRRGGFHHVNRTKDDGLARLVPFIFTREQSFMLEFGDEYIRFYRDNGYVQNVQFVHTDIGDGATTIFTYPYGLRGSLTVALDGVITAAYTTVDNDLSITVTFTAAPGDGVFITMYQAAFDTGDNVLESPEFFSSDEWILGTGWSITGSNAVYSETSSGTLTQITSGLEEEDYYLYFYVESTTGLDSLIITLGGLIIFNDPWPAGQTGFYAMMADLTGKSSDSLVFLANNGSIEIDRVGLHRIDDPTEGVAEYPIFELVSPYPIDEVFGLHYAQANDIMFFANFYQKPWQLLRFGDLDWRWTQTTHVGAPWEDGGYAAADGYPSTVTFFQQRLCYGATLAEPQTLWLSRAADFFEFTVPADPAPDDPLELTLAAQEHDAIEWISSEINMLMGTGRTEYRITSDSFVATNNLPSVEAQTHYGSRHIMPVFVGNQLVFVQQTGRQLRSFTLRPESYQQLYRSVDLTWLAEHMLSASSGGIIAMTFALVPDSVLWAIRADGALLSMVQDPALAESDFSKVGWSRHPMDGDVESIACIPTDTHEQLWAVIERDGKRYIEYLDPDVFVDSAFTYPPVLGLEGYPAISEATHLEHLEGKQVAILADDAVHTMQIVENGRVLLDWPASTVVIGLPYSSHLITMPVEAANPGGTAQAVQKRWNRIVARLRRSAYPNINGQRPPVRQPVTELGVPEPLVTGDVEIRNFGNDKFGQIDIETSLPLPCNVLGLFGDVSAGGG